MKLSYIIVSLLAVLSGPHARPLSEHGGTTTGPSLVDVPPAPAEIVEENRREDLGITEWKLSNGISVILKPTDFKNDEVLFTAFSPGGHSLVPDEDFVAAATAASVVLEGGVGAFSRIELRKLLAGRVVKVSPWIGELWEGISGGASPKDLEVMFQWIYLCFTAPRKDSLAFLAYRERMRSFLRNRSASPEAAFHDTIQVTMAQHHRRARPWSEALLAEMDLGRSFEIYRERFADAGDFTFIFVGNFDLRRIEPLVRTYLGGLPNVGRKETWRDVGMEPPKGVVEKTVRKGFEPKSLVQIIFSGQFEWTSRNRYEIISLADVLRIKLWETLRGGMGGIYRVGVRPSFSRYPDEEYYFAISFGCAPERVEELTETVFAQFDSLKEVGPAEIYIAKVKEIQRRRWETGLRKNEFWLNALQVHYLYGEDPGNILKYGELVGKLTPDAVRRAARTYLDTGNYVKVVLYPEG